MPFSALLGVKNDKKKKERDGNIERLAILDNTCHSGRSAKFCFCFSGLSFYLCLNLVKRKDTRYRGEHLEIYISVSFLWLKIT